MKTIFESPIGKPKSSWGGGAEGVELWNQLTITGYHPPCIAHSVLVVRIHKCSLPLGPIQFIIYFYYRDPWDNLRAIKPQQMYHGRAVIKVVGSQFGLPYQLNQQCDQMVRLFLYIRQIQY